MSAAGLGFRRAADAPARVTHMGLFFDLIFVFAITQISHGLLHHLTPRGALETVVLFMAVWWVWVYTASATNRLDPERAPVRAMLFGMMALGLLLAVALPKAFGEFGLVLALAHVAMQIGRTAFTWYALGPARPEARRNFLPILVWLAAAAPFWIAGGLAEGSARLALWGAALAIAWMSPALAFRVPGPGRSRVADRDVEGAHMAERCGLFVIIALGESILVTGATFPQQAWTAEAVLAFAAAFAAAFAGTLAMWWLVFDRGAGEGARRIEHAAEPGALARSRYTYLHVAIIGGIVLAAAGDEKRLAHPDNAADLSAVLLVCGGPALFLLGIGFFKRLVLGWFALSHRVALAALALAALASPLMPAWGLGVLTTSAMVPGAAWETLSLGGRPATES